MPTRGPRPNTAFIAFSLGANLLTPSGYVKIKPTFQLPSDSRIFVAGDIVDYPEQKQVGKYYTHADVVAANIVSLLAGQMAVKEYKGPALEGIIITIGKVYHLARILLAVCSLTDNPADSRRSVLWNPLGPSVWRLGIQVDQIQGTDGQHVTQANGTICLASQFSTDGRLLDLAVPGCQYGLLP